MKEEATLTMSKVPFFAKTSKTNVALKSRIRYSAKMRL